MTKNICFNGGFGSNNEIDAKNVNSGVCGQFNNRLKIELVMKDNPDLSFSFISETLMSQNENKKAVRYVRKTSRSIK